METWTTLIYDGSCGLCTESIGWIRWLDSGHRIETLPYQNPEVWRRYPTLDPAAAEQSVQCVAADGTVYSGALAVREVLSQLPALQPLTIAWRLPGVPPLLSMLYRRVSEHRHGISRRFLRGPAVCSRDAPSNH